MEKFTFTVLKDTSKSDKGNLTTFMRVSKPNGPLDSEIATGFVRTSVELKKGETFQLEGNSIQVKKSIEPITINGEEVYAEWIALV